MNFYIDESGSFANAKHSESWNAVASLAVPEIARKAIDVAVSQIRSSSLQPSKEVKLREVREVDYFRFLNQLEKAPIAVFCVATDAFLNTPSAVARHQSGQVEKILQNLDKMRFESGRNAVEKLGRDVANLSPQLYVQLICQLSLIHLTLTRAVTYFVQRTPRNLSNLRWRIDQKNSDRPTFEKTFTSLAPAILQTISLEGEPFILVNEFDYSAMQKYEYTKSTFPKYLEEDYGIKTSGSGWNVGKMITENLVFVDSKKSSGVQAIDLIVSGIRRCLRRQFDDNLQAAHLLGKLMIQAPNRQVPLELISLGDEALLHPEVERLVRNLAHSARPMLL